MYILHSLIYGPQVLHKLIFFVIHPLPWVNECIIWGMAQEYLNSFVTSPLKDIVKLVSYSPWTSF
jgi:hypothetical protein